MYKNILLPTDGSKLSAKAIMQGVQLAQSLRAKVTFLHVMPEYQGLKSLLLGSETAKVLTHSKIPVLVVR